MGLLWNPTKDGPRAFKPFLGYSTQPVKSNVSSFGTGNHSYLVRNPENQMCDTGADADLQSELVQINKDAILAEISRMGEGLIEKIERGKVIA